jgi:hypothetical protein
MVMVIYGIPQILESLRFKKVHNDLVVEVERNDSISIVGIACGIIGGLFWGIPHRAACKALLTKNIDIELAQSHSEAAGSILALALVLSGGGARSGNASMISGIEFSSVAIIGMLFISVALTGIIYLTLLNNEEDQQNKTLSLFSVFLCVAFICHFQGTIGFVLIAIGLMLHRLMKYSEADKELSLISISIIPLINLIGI